jgi:GNAT superfamily N-acetyltransferase
MANESFTLRAYCGASDLPGMTAAANRQVDRDGDGEYLTVAGMAAQYEHLQRCDPDRDIVVADDPDGAVVGYARTMWEDLAEGFRQYWLVVNVDPSIPGLEIGLLDWIERRALDPLLMERGFAPRMFYAAMVRPDLADIPDAALPEGLEIRAVEPLHLRQIWEADIEAFRDHNDYVEQTEKDWERFRADAKVDTTLWQVAWSGDIVVGQVRTHFNAEESERSGRRRGWTEDISTRREWRKQGVASALIAASLRQLRSLGFDEAALGVDTDNPNRALRVYESLGFEIVHRGALYERPV